jgi:mannose-6-phosphate isomerase-like protein (cupin superfamily)
VKIETIPTKMTDKVPKTIRPLNRYITTHNASGEAIFSNTLSEEMPVQRLADSADFSLAYTSDHFPAKLNNESDIAEYSSYLSSPPGIVISSGTVCRIVDMQPGATSPMHRTVSLDYGVVLEGEVELVLDSGETRLLKRGDVAVQRGTNHAWKNVTPDVVVDGKSVPQWARMLYVLAPSEELEIEGKKLTEVVDGIGVRAST